jgi:hypothetical protein
MSCIFDEKRPCNSTSKEKNRYTRAEIVSLAKICGIENISKKTMTELCNEIRLQNNKKNLHEFDPQWPCGSKINTKNKYTKIDLVKFAKKYGIKNYSTMSVNKLCNTLKDFINKNQHTSKKSIKPIIKKKSTPHKIPNVIKKIGCNSTSKHAYKPNYYCNEKTKRWTRIKGSKPYYYKYELYNMTQTVLTNIAKQLNVKQIPLTKTQLIQKILQKQYPLVQGQTKKNIFAQKYKKTLLQWKHKINLKKGNIKPTKVITEIPFYSAPSLHGGVLQIFTNNKFTLKKISLHISGIKYINSIFKNYISDDIDGMIKNTEWFEKQYNYQMGLPFLKQLVLLSYTYGGDRMIHSWLDNNLQIEQIWGSSYESMYVCPLFPTLIILMFNKKDDFKDILNTYILKDKQFKDKVNMYKTKYNNFSVFCIKYSNVISSPKNMIKYILDNLDYEVIKNYNVDDISYGNTIFDDYKNICLLLFNCIFFHDDFYYMLCKNFYTTLKNIILHSPPLDSSLIVYKGLKDINFLDFTQNNMYKNKRFISTSIKTSISTTSAFTNSDCCIQKIFLLKRTLCLYVFISYFSEYEIILPPDRYMYATSNIYKPPNNSRQSINLVITN